MPKEYQCAYCEAAFASDAAGPTPACPTCGQTESVRAVDSAALVGEIRRQWFAVFAVLFAAGAAFAAYQWWFAG